MRQILFSLAFILALILAPTASASDILLEGAVAAVSGDKITITFAHKHDLTVNNKVKIGGKSPNAKPMYGKRVYTVYMVGLGSAVNGNEATVTLYGVPRVQTGDEVQVRRLSKGKRGG